MSLVMAYQSSRQPPRHWREWSDDIFAEISAGGFDHTTYRQALHRWRMNHPRTPLAALLHAQQRLDAHYGVLRESELKENELSP
jgi:hypothetical protein